MSAFAVGFRRWATGVCVAVLAFAATGGALATGGPELPFEPYFAQARGTGQVLRFNDFSGRIGEKRIKALLRSGEILGDRVLLQNGTAVYFPEGYIVLASIALDRYRPKDGKRERSVRSLNDLEPNPDYGLANSFESLLGPVCAEAQGAAPGTSIRVRRTKDGVLSVINVGPGRFDALSGEQSVSYRVVSAIDATYLYSDPRAAQLVGRCLAH